MCFVSFCQKKNYFDSAEYFSSSISNNVNYYKSNWRDYKPPKWAKVLLLLLHLDLHQHSNTPSTIHPVIWCLIEQVKFKRWTTTTKRKQWIFVTLHPPVATTNSAPPPQQTSPGSCSTYIDEKLQIRPETIYKNKKQKNLHFQSPAQSAERKRDGSCRREPCFDFAVDSKISPEWNLILFFWAPPPYLYLSEISFSLTPI